MGAIENNVPLSNGKTMEYQLHEENDNCPSLMKWKISKSCFLGIKICT